MKKITLKQGLISILAGAAAGAAAWVFPLFLMIFPSVLGTIGMAFGSGGLCIALVTACGILFAQVNTIGIVSCISNAAMLVIPSIVITLTLKKRRSYRYAAAFCAFVIALAQYGDTCLIPLMELGDPFAYYTEYAAYYADFILQSAAEVGLDQLGMEQMQYIAAYFKHSAPDIAVISIIGSSMIAGLLNILIAKNLCKKFNLPVKAMAPIHKWQLSSSYYRGALILVIGALIISFTNIKNTSAIMMAISLIIVGPYSLMGLCFMLFSIRKKKRGKGFVIFAAAAMLFLLPYSVYGLCMMGVADRMFGIRRFSGKAK